MPVVCVGERLSICEMGYGCDREIQECGACVIATCQMCTYIYM